MKKIKRMLAAMLCVLTVLSSIPFSNIQVSADDESTIVDGDNANNVDSNIDNDTINHNNDANPDEIETEELSDQNNDNENSKENLNEDCLLKNNDTESDESNSGISILSGENEDSNISVASNSDGIDITTASQNWDISLNSDGSVMAYFFDDGLLYITGNGTKKPFGYNDDISNDYRSKRDQITKVIVSGDIGGNWNYGRCEIFSVNLDLL